MVIINDGMIYEAPERSKFSFKVEYNHREVIGIAKGSDMPLNTMFDIELSGNTFTLEAIGNGNGSYTWQTNNGAGPLVALTPLIGKEIEKHFEI